MQAGFQRIAIRIIAAIQRKKFNVLGMYRYLRAITLRIRADFFEVMDQMTSKGLLPDFC